MKLGRWLIALSVLCLPLASHADTFSGSASFSDTSPSGNNLYNFSGSFANPTFSFTGGTGTVYSDALTINTNFALGCCAPGDSLSVAVNYTDPNAASTSFSGTGTAYFIGVFGIGNDIDWTSNLQTVMFSDGSSLQLYLPNFDYAYTLLGQFGSNTQDLTMTVLSAAPEPSSFLLLGTGILLLAFLLRRKALAI